MLDSSGIRVYAPSGLTFTERLGARNCPSYIYVYVYIYIYIYIGKRV
jgi:hypothetical protein